MIVELGHMVIHRTYHCMVVYPSTLMASAVLYEPSGVPLGEGVCLELASVSCLHGRGTGVNYGVAAS